MIQLEQLKQLAISYSPVTAALGSGTLGAVAEGSGIIQAGNMAIVTLVCGMAGAFFAGLPKIISSWHNAKLKDSEFVGREMRGLITLLKGQVIAADQISAITSEFRHMLVNAYHQRANHCAYLEALLEDNHIMFHQLTYKVDLQALQKDMDTQIKEIKVQQQEATNKEENEE